ncbi:hypothetical protein B0H10DRAFT_1989886 [Mycena sp. CBHHK59/15]|nr:hypothetical protein B0H10DRAFT_1989886 [Mycena sp. CBHHK59/15]
MGSRRWWQCNQHFFEGVFSITDGKVRRKRSRALYLPMAIETFIRIDHNFFENQVVERFGQPPNHRPSAKLQALFCPLLGSFSAFVFFVIFLPTFPVTFYSFYQLTAFGTFSSSDFNIP